MYITRKGFQKEKSALEEAALQLARENADAEPAIERIYLFPDTVWIRLVAVDPTVLPSEEISPYYFDANPASGMPYPIAIAMIRPEEEAAHIPPPSEWPDWKEASLLWPEASNAVNGK